MKGLFSFISYEKKNKTSFILITAIVLLVCAKLIISDLSFYSPNFAYGNFDFKTKINLRLDDVNNKPGRSLASFYLENESLMNAYSKNLIGDMKNFLNGEWILYKIIKDEGPILSDNLRVKIKIVGYANVGKNKVQIEALNVKGSTHKLNNKIFALVSYNKLIDDKLFSDEIGLWREVSLADSENTEFVYLKKIFKKDNNDNKDNNIKDKKNKSNEKPSIASNSINGNSNNTNTNTSINIKDNEFQLIEVTAKSKIIDVIKSGGATGSLKMDENLIKSLDTNFDFEGNEVSINISNTKLINNYFYYFIDNGQQSVSGAINRFGEDEYIITLVNGPYSGVKLKFATNKKINSIMAESNNNAKNMNGVAFEDTSAITDQNINNVNISASNIQLINNDSNNNSNNDDRNFGAAVENNKERDQIVNTEEAVIIQNELLTSRYEEMKAMSFSEGSVGDQSTTSSAFRF
ncbi:MAG: hypothetical protein HQK51_02335 [Oligoflexia bacterium]|nr:hypothetical protein [Oligoflexia bacterium]